MVLDIKTFGFDKPVPGKLKNYRARKVLINETHLLLYPLSPMWMLHATLNSTEALTPRLNNNIWQTVSENVFWNEISRNHYNFDAATNTQ